MKAAFSPVKRIIDYMRESVRRTVPIHATVPRNYTSGQLVTIERRHGGGLIDYGVYAVQGTITLGRLPASDVRDMLIDAPAHLADLASTQAPACTSL